jgi:hypothetical protein
MAKKKGTWDSSKMNDPMESAVAFLRKKMKQTGKKKKIF